ncbi:MAG: efflux RND transporter periplasmic adaptor subunit [Bacteroidota bacterium]
MKNNIIYTLLIAAIGTSLPSCSSDKGIEENPGELDFTRVDYFVCKAENLENIVSIPGKTAPFEKIDVYPEINGVVEQIHFDEGTPIKKGQLLVSIDTDVLEAEREQLKVDLRLAQKNKARKKQLLESEAGTEEAFEQAANEVEKLEAQIQSMNVQIEKGQIIAPFDGVTGLRYISEGAYVTPSNRITTLAQIDPLKVEFAVDQQFAHKVKKGQPFSIVPSTDSLNVPEIEGEVYAKEPMINANTKMLTVRGIIEHQEGLVPGGFVNVKYNMGVSANSIKVPTAAIVPDMEGQIVWVFDNGKAKQVKVNVGTRSSEYIQVFGDIAAQDTVVMTGLLGMKEGKLIQSKNNVQ